MLVVDVEVKSLRTIAKELRKSQFLRNHLGEETLTDVYWAIQISPSCCNEEKRTPATGGLN